MKFYLRLIFYLLLLYLVLISINFHFYLKNLSYFDESFWIFYIWEFVITTIYIIQISISTNKINEVKQDLIIFRIKGLSKRNLGVRRILGLLMQPLIWLGLISYEIMNRYNYDLFQFLSGSYRSTFLKRFIHTQEEFDVIFPVLLSLAHGLILLFELMHRLYSWIADGFKKN